MDHGLSLIQHLLRHDAEPLTAHIRPARAGSRRCTPKTAADRSGEQNCPGQTWLDCSLNDLLTSAQIRCSLEFRGSKGRTVKRSGRYAKAIAAGGVSGIVAFLTSVATALQGRNLGWGSITAGQWVTEVLAGLVGSGLAGVATEEATNGPPTGRRTAS